MNLMRHTAIANNTGPFRFSRHDFLKLPSKGARAKSEELAHLTWAAAKPPKPKNRRGAKARAGAFSILHYHYPREGEELFKKREILATFNSAYAAYVP